MPNETDTGAHPASFINGYVAGFNRYGLPGVVIGALFAIVAAQFYVMVNTMQANTRSMTDTLQSNTRAMSEMTAAVARLTETIKDRPQ